MEFDLKRFTRKCCVTDRELQAGEVYYSALVNAEGNVLRKDFAADAWQGAPEGAIGWWKATVVTPESMRQHWAPQDVMLHLFDQLSDQPEQQDLRYLLTLLMVRRRILRVQGTERDADGTEYLLVHSSKLDEDQRIVIAHPEGNRKEQIQNQLRQLIVERAA